MLEVLDLAGDGGVGGVVDDGESGVFFEKLGGEHGFEVGEQVRAGGAVAGDDDADGGAGELDERGKFPLEDDFTLKQG
jgi:hypothetical protein